MGAADLQARVVRLEKLVMGLASEDDIAQKELPLRSNEMLDYRNALGDASGAKTVVGAGQGYDPFVPQAIGPNGVRASLLHGKPPTPPSTFALQSRHPP